MDLDVNKLIKRMEEFERTHIRTTIPGRRELIKQLYEDFLFIYDDCTATMDEHEENIVIMQFAPHGGHWCVCQRPPGGAQRPPSLRYFDRLNNNNVMLRCPLHNSVG